MSINTSDARAIDALCVVRCGWTGPPGGRNHSDWLAANEVVEARAHSAAGSFRPPTEAELMRAALAEALQVLEYTQRSHPEITGGLRLYGAIEKIKALGIKPA